MLFKIFLFLILLNPVIALQIEPNPLIFNTLSQASFNQNITIFNNQKIAVSDIKISFNTDLISVKNNQLALLSEQKVSKILYFKSLNEGFHNYLIKTKNLETLIHLGVSNEKEFDVNELKYINNELLINFSNFLGKNQTINLVLKNEKNERIGNISLIIDLNNSKHSLPLKLNDFETYLLFFKNEDNTFLIKSFDFKTILNKNEITLIGLLVPVILMILGLLIILITNYFKNSLKSV